MRAFIFVLTMLALGCTQDQPVILDNQEADFQEVPDFFLDLGFDGGDSTLSIPNPENPEAEVQPAAICGGSLCPFGAYTARVISFGEDLGWDVLESTEDTGMEDPDMGSGYDAEEAPFGFYGDPCTEDTHCRSDICGFDNTCVECHGTDGCSSDQVCIRGQCEYPLVYGGDLTVEASYADPHEGSSVDVHLVNIDRVPEGVDPRDAFNTPADCFLEGCFQTTNGETSQQVLVLDHAPARFLIGIQYQGPFSNNLTAFVRLRGRPGLTRTFEMPVNPGDLICLGVVDTAEATWDFCGQDGHLLID